MVLGGQRAGPIPLANAMVTLSQGPESRTLYTDSQGRYRVSGLPPGRWRVQAIHVGYRATALDVVIPEGGRVELVMELTWSPILLGGVIVRAEPVSPRKSTRPASRLEVGELSLRAMEGSTGMVEAGLAQVMRSMPGNDDAEPTDVLLMRGSTTDMKLVLLDGAPVFTPFHMGGLVESFDPGALGGASLFLGGAPARFDGGLSYILDLQTRAPRLDTYRGSASMDLLTGRALLEGPLSSSTGFLVNTRWIHNLGAPVLDQGDAPYGYKDLLGRWDWSGEQGFQAFATAFWNREDVRLDLPTRAPFGAASWGNQSLAAGLSGPFGSTEVEIRASLSRYDAELPVADSLPLFAESRTDRMRFTADLTRPVKDGEIAFGASLDRSISDYSAQTLDEGGIESVSEFALDGNSAGAYLEGTRSLDPSLRIRAGIRADGFSGSPGIRLAPRAAVSWLLTDNAVLTLAAGRYHQYASLASKEMEKNLSNRVDEATGGVLTPALSVGRADHLVVSLDQILTPSIRLGVQGFMKNFSGISGEGGSSLNSSGVDLRVAREGDRVSGWLGYTLTWFWVDESGFLGGDSRFSGRHLLSAGLSTLFTDRTGLRLRVGYGDGLPFTSVPIHSSAPPGADEASGVPTFSNFLMDSDNLLNQAPGLSAGPDDGFLRVEAEVYAVWETSIGGRRGQLRPYVRVLNALNRRDALFYHFDPWRNPDLQPLAELPILPLVGLEWVF